MATAEEYTGNELVPPEGHPKVGFRVFEILAEVLQHKNDMGLPAKWMRNYELSKNRHWRNQSKKAPLVTANLLHSHRVRTVNMLTDNNPCFDVIQVGEVENDPEKEDVFDTLLKTTEFWWGDSEQQNVLEAAVLNGEIYGVTFEKVVFNRELEGGLGEVETLVIEPFHIGWYPVKTMDLQKAQAVLHFYPMSAREARWRWPNKASEITSDEETIKMLGDTRMEIKANSTAGDDQGYFTAIGNAIKQVISSFGTAGGSKNAVGGSEELLVCEAWVRDRSRAKNEDGTKEFSKYPGDIRCIITCNAGKVVLEDKPNPSINPELDAEQASSTYLWSHFPFSKAMSHTDTGNPWGMGDFEQLEMLNIEINKTISQLTMVKDKTARLKLINPKDTGVSNAEFTNSPGIINPSSALVAQGIRYLDPPTINPELFKMMDIYRDLFFLVAGSFELEQANTPGSSVIAYKAIAALLERAATMHKGKIRNYTKMIRERGRMYISHVMNWYTEERFISYEQDGKKMSQAIHGSEMLIPAKLQVVSGSTMPVSRVQEREEASALFDKGAIDAEELLKKLNWKDYKDVIKRVKAGPIGEFIEKLGMMGFPPALLQGLQEVGAMEMDDFERELEQGKIPQLQQLLSAPGPGEGEDPVMQAEAQLTEAKAQREMAEIELIKAKVKTEEVVQMTKIAGIKFDKAKLSQDQARLINDIRSQERAMGTKDREVGIKAKQFGVKEDKPKQPPAQGKAAQDRFQNPQAPYVEKGLKSNNEARE